MSNYGVFKGGAGAGSGSSGSGGSTLLVLGTFRAIANGTGYSIDDIIILLQEISNPPYYLNSTTNAVITPLPADLGAVSSSSNVAVTSSALPNGAAIESKQLPDNHQVSVSNTSLNVVVDSGDIAVTGTVTANTGLNPLTDTQLRLTPVPVSLASVPSHNVTNTGTFAVQSTTQGNNGVDIGDVTVNNAGLTQAVNIQDGGNVITVDGTVNAAQSGSWNIGNITGTVSLPTGAATDLSIAGLDTLLTTIEGNMPTLDTGYVPVKLDASQIATITPPGAITGFATSAKQPSFNIPGTPSTDVITVQGITSGTPLAVNGTVTAELGTTDTANLADVKIAVESIDAKLVQGTIIGTVRIDSSTGNEVVISDGGSSITIDGSVAVIGDVATDIGLIEGKIPSNLTVTSTRLLVDGSGVTQPISGTVTANTGLTQPLTNAELRTTPPTVELTSGQITTLTPPAAITGFALESTLSNVLSALNGNVNFNETIWTDDTGAFFARRVSQNEDTNSITVTYWDIAGVAYVPGANPRPAGGTGGGGGVDREIVSTLYVAIATDTEYTIGDVINRMDVINVEGSTPAVISSFYYNTETKLYLTAFPAGDFDYVATNDYATATNQATTNTNLGAKADAAATSDNGSFSLISLTKRGLEHQTTLIDKTPDLGQALAASSIPVVLASNQSTISVTANAGTNLNTSSLAVEAGGNLENINNKLPPLGQALASASIPVVLTVNQLNALAPISDATADNQVNIGQQTTTINDGTNYAGITSLSNDNGLNVVVKDINGNQINSENGLFYYTRNYFESEYSAIANGLLNEYLIGDNVKKITIFEMEAGSQNLQCFYVYRTHTLYTYPVATADLVEKSPVVSVPGVALATKQDVGNISLDNIDGKLPSLGQALAVGSVPVVLTAAQLSTLTPPAPIVGFALAAKQPALGTAGTPSTDVITVQGDTAGTPLPVSGTIAATQSGTWAVNLPTGASTAANQTTLGNQTTKINDGTTTVDALDLTNNNALVVAVVDGAGNQITAFGGSGGGGTEYTDGSLRGTPTGSLIMVDDGTNIQSASGDSSGKLNVNATQTGTWTVDSITNSVAVTGAFYQATQPVSIASTIGTNLVQIGGITPAVGNGVTGTGSQRVTIASDNTAFTVNAQQSGAWTVTSNLPTGAATEAKQDSGNLSLSSLDGKINLGQALAAGSLPVVLTAAQVSALTPPAAITGFATEAKQYNVGIAGTPSADVVSIQGVSGGVGFNVNATQSGTWNIGTITTIPLATNAATNTLQTSGNASLTSIDGKVPALGQALAAGSVPVVLTAAQLSTITPPAAISGFAVESKQPALGTAGVPSADVISIQGVASGTVIPVTGTVAATQSGTWNIGSITNAVAVTGAFWQTTQPVSLTSTTLTGTSDVNLSQVGGVAIAVGNGTTSTGSQRVTIASDNTAFSVNAVQSGTWNINNVSGTVSLPTGAATSLLQTNGNSSLTSIDGKLPNLGQALAAASIPVVLTAAQLTTLTPPGGSSPVVPLRYPVDNSPVEFSVLAGTAKKIIATNNNTTTCYLKIWDMTLAPSIGADPPTYTVIFLPKKSTWVLELELYCANGLYIAATSGIADLDTGSPGGNIDISVHWV